MFTVMENVSVYCQGGNECLGTSAKIAKSNCQLRQICPFRLSAWNNSAPAGRIFIKIDIWTFFRKNPVEKIRVSLEPDTNNAYFT